MRYVPSQFLQAVFKILGCRCQNSEPTEHTEPMLPGSRSPPVLTLYSDSYIWQEPPRDQDIDPPIGHSRNDDDMFTLLNFAYNRNSASPAANSRQHTPSGPLEDLDKFNLDLDEPVATAEPVINLASLQESQELITLIQNANFDDEKAQWMEEEFQNFRNPPPFQSDIEDQHELLSFRIYLSLG